MLFLQASGHSVNGMYLGVTDSNTFLLSAGSDMRIRYWDLSYPANSHIVAGAASDPANQAVVSYRYVESSIIMYALSGDLSKAGKVLIESHWHSI